MVGLEHRKKFAQFFTPEPIADFMARWVLEGRKKADVLEPAFGLGVFTCSMRKLEVQVKVVGYELDATIYNYGIGNVAQAGSDVYIYNEDYLRASWNEKYDVIICNPPYLKFHDYDNASLVPLVNSQLGVHLNGFTNLYTLFLLKSISQLREGGRLAYIVPSEFLNSDYGVEVKRVLLESGVMRHVVVVDFTQCAFDDALTTACILLCHKSEGPYEVRFSHIDDVERLPASLSEYSAWMPDQLNPETKWKQYYEGARSAGYRHLVPFSTFAKVSRGIATGANDYFTFKESKREMYGIPEQCLMRCVCHSTDVTGLFFTDEVFKQLSRQDKAMYLFDGCAGEENEQVREYIALGEEIGADKRFLTASRKPWYAVENRKPSPIWVSVFNRKGLRFVRNVAGVSNLTTFHCVYDAGVVDIDVLFGYLVTDVAKEIFMDNSRQYGNGLVKFEPNDLNKGMAVDLRLLTKAERAFVRKASRGLQHERSENEIIPLLDSFFREKFSGGSVRLSHYCGKLDELKSSAPNLIVERVAPVRAKQLNFSNLFNNQTLENVAELPLAHEDEIPQYGCLENDMAESREEPVKSGIGRSKDTF